MRSDSSALAVSMMIGMAAVVASARIARQSCRPSSPGSIRSSTTRSGVSRLICGMTSRPDATSVGQEAGLFQVMLEQAPDVGIVFGDEDPCGRPH